MDKIARRVAARYALHIAMGDWQPDIPSWVVPWVDGQIRTAYGRESPDTVPDGQLDTLFDPRKKRPTYEPNYADHPNLYVTPKREEYPGKTEFDEAKTSIEIMLPNFLKALAKHFGDRFYMNATQQKAKLYYYFSAHPAMETVALTLTLKGGHPLIWLGYVPHKVVSGADFSRSIHESVRVSDPELAGLSMMRSLRKLLERID